MSAQDFDAAREAWRLLRAGGKVPSGWLETQVLDTFFGIAAPTSYQYANVTIERQVRAQCPEPSAYGGDQYKCLKCGRIWDRNDDKPECNMEEL